MKKTTTVNDLGDSDGAPNLRVWKGAEKLTFRVEEIRLWTGTSYTWEGRVGNEALAGLGSMWRVLERKRVESRFPRSWSKSSSKQ